MNIQSMVGLEILEMVCRKSADEELKFWHFFSCEILISSK
jgi:hypothetical protein